MDRISDAERQRIAELLAEGAPTWRLHKEFNRSRYAIRRAVVALHRPPKREPRRSPLRLSLAEREEISRGLAAGEPVRESNENANGLLRQYFPRNTDFRALTQRDLDAVAAELNDRPRQTPGWKSPCQALDEAL
jgi:IS30 family transposase